MAIRIRTATQQVRYPMDNYDGGRAATEPEQYAQQELGWVKREYLEQNEDVRTLALAIVALSRCGD